MLKSLGRLGRLDGNEMVRRYARKVPVDDDPLKRGHGDYWAGYHWDGIVHADDYLSVTEISGIPVVVFVSTVPGTEKVKIQVRHAQRARD